MMSLSEKQRARIRRLHIGVFMGGISSERDISLKSGTGVVKALTNVGCRVTPIDIHNENPKDIIELVQLHQIDIAFIALHGRFGEDGRLQAILDRMHLPYTGSDAQASRVAMNKFLTYRRLQECHVRVPSFLLVDKSQAQELMPEIHTYVQGRSAVVKPVSEGSSFGVTIVTKEQEIPQAMAQAFQYGDQILVESYIQGKELTVGVLGNTLLPVVEIQSPHSFFDFKAKYQAGTTDYIVPAALETGLAQYIQQIAWRVHQAIGCRHLSRVDILLDSHNIPWVLEINTIPGMTQTSLLPKAAASVGINFEELCLRLVHFAYERQK